MKHQRSGHLFQGRYKAILVDKDEYAKELSGKPSINEIAEYTKSILGEDRALSRGIQIYLICKYSGKMLKEIGKHFNIGASGVSQASRRIAIKMDEDSGLRKKICRIENSLKLSIMKT